MLQSQFEAILGYIGQEGDPVSTANKDRPVRGRGRRRWSVQLYRKLQASHGSKCLAPPPKKMGTAELEVLLRKAEERLPVLGKPQGSP